MHKYLESTSACLYTAKAIQNSNLQHPESARLMNNKVVLIGLIIGAIVVGLAGEWFAWENKAKQETTQMQSPNNDEHLVKIYFDYGQTDLTPMHDLEDQLIEMVSQAGVGEVDGHDIAMDASHGFFYIYGPDAHKIMEVIRPALEAADCLKNVSATLSLGENGTTETVKIERKTHGS